MSKTLFPQCATLGAEMKVRGPCWSYHRFSKAWSIGQIIALHATPFTRIYVSLIYFFLAQLPSCFPSFQTYNGVWCEQWNRRLVVVWWLVFYSDGFAVILALSIKNQAIAVNLVLSIRNELATTRKKSVSTKLETDVWTRSSQFRAVRVRNEARRRVSVTAAPWACREPKAAKTKTYPWQPTLAESQWSAGCERCRHVTW